MIIYYEYDKDYHYDVDDRVDNIWLRADWGGESVLCLGADSKVQEGVAEPRSKHQNFHTFYTDSPSYYYDHFKSSSLSLGFRKIGTQKFFEYTNNDNSLNTYYYI